MGLLFRHPQLEHDEKVVWSTFANRSQGNRGVGGKLFVTTGRVWFMAHRIDHALRGEDWSVRRSAVSWVGLEARSLVDGPFSGGLRVRLRVDTRHSHPELFVVNRAAAKAELLRSELGLHEPGDDARVGHGSIEAIRSESRREYATILPWPYWVGILLLSLWFLVVRIHTMAVESGGPRLAEIIGILVGVSVTGLCGLQLFWLLTHRRR